jgi:hypothetical protein
VSAAHHLDTTVAAIDAATGCQHCGGPLGTSPSTDFCAEDCQTLWRRHHHADPATAAAAHALDEERWWRTWAMLAGRWEQAYRRALGVEDHADDLDARRAALVEHQHTQRDLHGHCVRGQHTGWIA